MPQLALRRRLLAAGALAATGTLLLTSCAGGFDDDAAEYERCLQDLGDGRLTVRGVRPGVGGLLAAAGTLVADSVTGGAVTGLGTLARGLVGEAVGGVVGEAAQAAARAAVEPCTPAIWLDGASGALQLRRKASRPAA